MKLSIDVHIQLEQVYKLGMQEVGLEEQHIQLERVHKHGEHHKLQEEHGREHELVEQSDSMEQVLAEQKDGPRSFQELPEQQGDPKFFQKEHEEQQGDPKSFQVVEQRDHKLVKVGLHKGCIFEHGRSLVELCHKAQGRHEVDAQLVHKKILEVCHDTYLGLHHGFHRALEDHQACLIHIWKLQVFHFFLKWERRSFPYQQRVRRKECG